MLAVDFLSEPLATAHVRARHCFLVMIDFRGALSRIIAHGHALLRAYLGIKLLTAGACAGWVQAHKDRNLARKLTPAERKEKKHVKLVGAAGEGEAPTVAVYAVDRLAKPPHRFKVRANAEVARRPAFLVPFFLEACICAAKQPLVPACSSQCLVYIALSVQ